MGCQGISTLCEKFFAQGQIGKTCQSFRHFRQNSRDTHLLAPDGGLWYNISCFLSPWHVISKPNGPKRLLGTIPELTSLSVDLTIYFCTSFLPSLLPPHPSLHQTGQNLSGMHRAMPPRCAMRLDLHIAVATRNATKINVSLAMRKQLIIRNKIFAN